MKPLTLDDFPAIESSAAKGAELTDAHALDLPRIPVVAGQLPRIVDQSEAAIKSSGLPVFVRAGALVRPVIEKMPAAKNRWTAVAKLQEIGTNAAIDILARVAVYERFDARSKKWTHVDPPERAAAILLTRQGQWALDRIAGVITTPTLRPDGTVLEAPGYDAATRLFLTPDTDLRMAPVKPAPSKADAESALKLLSDLLVGFPFVSEIDRAVALSGLLTPVLRGGMGAAPMHAIRSYAPGTGKSYLIDLAARIATGRPCPVIAAGKTEEETEKRLGSLLREGVPIICLDNVNGELGGDALCQLTERPIVRIRILGRSETPEFECRATIFANGNNLVLLGDMTRRAVLCTLDAELERPELREFAFDPVRRVLENRAAYVHAALTIARAYRAAGSPVVCGHIGSYEDWTNTVRAPLIWLGVADPVESMERAREEDPELASIRELFGHWSEHLSEVAQYTAVRIIEVACEEEYSSKRYPEFNDFLLRMAGAGREISSRRLGRWLTKICGRVVDQRKLTVSTDAHGSRYALTRRSP